MGTAANINLLPDLRYCDILHRNTMFSPVTILSAFLLICLAGAPIKAQTAEQKDKPFTGNGCNLIRSTNLLPCCTPHDHAYKEGGSIGRRWDADAQLFKCVWKKNKLAAPFIWLGVQTGGLFVFQWGKRKQIPQPTEHPSTVKQ